MPKPEDIIGRRIFTLTAHPDDESFLASGTIYRNNTEGGQTFLVCATLGEKGQSHLDTPLPEEELQVVRLKELRAACKLLSVTEFQELDFPDGSVDQYEDELYSQAVELLQKFRPELIMSFGTDGITGHRDHIAVSKVAERLHQKTNIPLATFCIPGHVIEQSYEWIKNRQSTKGHYVKNFELSAGNIDIAIDSDLKLRCLKKYKSQLDSDKPFSDFPEHIAEAMLTQESFCLSN